MEKISRAIIILLGILIMVYYVMYGIVFLMTPIDYNFVINPKIWGFDVNAGQINYYDFFIPLFVMVMILSFTKRYKYNFYIASIVIISTLILNYKYALYAINDYATVTINYFSIDITGLMQLYNGTTYPSITESLYNVGLIYSSFIILILAIEYLYVKVLD